jgi:hypothetical protein
MKSPLENYRVTISKEALKLLQKVFQASTIPMEIVSNQMKNISLDEVIGYFVAEHNMRLSFIYSENRWVGTIEGIKTQIWGSVSALTLEDCISSTVIEACYKVLKIDSSNQERDITTDNDTGDDMLRDNLYN